VEYPSGHGETVLLVDDEPAILQITQTLLETYQYQVLTVDNGQAAIDLYTQKSDTIDLILLDMMMPSMSGITAIQALQRINPQVKIIACSGLTTNQRSITDAGLTVQAFLPKPYSTGNLLNALAQVLQAE
jgi:CheY-like chemotaxis protein